MMIWADNISQHRPQGGEGEEGEEGFVPAALVVPTSEGGDGAW
jgi:hypothetical protein